MQFARLDIARRAYRLAAVLSIAFVAVWAATGIGAAGPRFSVSMVGSDGKVIEGRLPYKVTVDSPGVPETPGFTWNNVPAGARSLALLVRGRSGGREVYSLLYNINKYRPISYNELRDVQFSGRRAVFTLGANDFSGDYEFFAPANPAANKSLSLDVTLYAISERELQGGLDVKGLLAAMKGKIVGTASARYTYKSRGLVIELHDSEDALFASGAELPTDYSPYEPGIPLSPGIKWYGASSAASSLALVVRDVSADNAVHALLYNIDPTVSIPFNEIASAQASVRFPVGVGGVGLNDYADDYPVFAPPFPPQVEQHTYVYTLYALAGPTLPNGLTIEEFDAAVEGQVLQRATTKVKFKAPPFRMVLRTDLDVEIARNAKLPVVYTGYATPYPVSPAIDWEYAPLDATFIAVLVTDDTIDAVHSLVYNLDPMLPLAFDELTADQDLGPPYLYGVGVNDFADDYPVYAPPEPPLGERHKYTYTVYAYSGSALADGLSLSAFQTAVADKVLATRSAVVQCELPKAR